MTNTRARAQSTTKQTKHKTQASRLLLLPPGAATRRSGGGGGGGGAARRNSGSGRASPPPSSLGSEHQQHHQQHQHQQHQHHHQQSVNEGDEDDQDDPVAYWGYWGDGQASSLAAAEAAADEAAAAAAAAAEATSTALSSSAGAARLVASLPASAMFETAFFSADRDGDGRLTRGEAALLLFYVTATSGDGAREVASAARRRAREAVAEAQAVAAATTAAAASSSSTSTAAPQTRTWDEHLVADWRRAALASRGGVPAAALRFAARALAGRAHEQSSWGGGSDDEKAGARQAPSAPPRPTTRAAAALLSDILWSALFAGAAVAALGAFAAAAPSLPLVGAWHQQQGASSAALPLLLSSFGALCVLLFARPESEAVRVWNVVAGQLAGTALAIACLTLLGPGLWARAVGMAAVVGFMLWADCAHPPGGALALFAMDHAPALLPSAAGWAFCLWPSLTLTLGVLMPLGWLCNHMKRTARFGWPGGVAAAASLGEGRGAAESSPLPAARPASPLPLPVVEVAGAAAAAPYDPAPLRRRYHVRSSDGGGWIEDMT